MLRIDTTSHAIQNLDSDHKEKIMIENNLSKEWSRKRDIPSKGKRRLSFLSSHAATRALCCFLAALMTVTGVGSVWAADSFVSPADALDETSLVIGGPIIDTDSMMLALDTDGDGVMDVFDNCSSVPNAGALSCDSDMDGYGNACDADFNNDGVSDGMDFASPHFIADFGTGFQSDNADGNGQGTDMNCDGSVDGLDFMSPYFLAGFGAGIPGPSGLSCAGLEPCDASLQPRAAFQSPGALYTGQYAYVPFEIRPDWAVSFDDFVFEVVEGSGAGQVSYSKDATFDPDHPTLMLLAGPEVGNDYTLRALYDGVEVANTKFSITTDWNHEGQGPPRWIEGPLGDPGPEGSAFGGTGAFQNFEVNPVSVDDKDWEVAVVLVDFNDRAFADGEAAKTEWVNAFNDPTDSVNDYYQELSGGQFSVNATGFGPVQLDGNWKAVHTETSNGLWMPEFAFYQNCVTAAEAEDAGFDINQYHTLVCVSATDTTDVAPSDGVPDSTEYTWPYAKSGRTVQAADGDDLGDEPDSVTVGTISMPDEWEIVDGRPIHHTLSHEMGHNLGIGDQYSPSVPAGDAPGGTRNLRNWEIMHRDTELPHFSLPFRMGLGELFLDADEHIKILDPKQEEDGLISEKVTLTAVEKITPDEEDHVIGVEFSITDGRSYTFEYRHGQAGHIGDQGPTVPGSGVGLGQVLGVDVVDDPSDFLAGMERPTVLHLAGYEELSAKDDLWYEDDPDSDNRLEVEVTEIDSDSVELWFRYGSNSAGIWDGASPAPDLVIRPWPSATHKWQSPDISISNALSAEDATFENVAVAGIENTITATVVNSGNLDVTGVTVNFWVKDQNAGASVPKTYIGKTELDVAAGASVPFPFPSWVPPAEGHFCVVAEIEEIDGEQSFDNNSAQSNYDVVESGSSSPAERIIRDVAVSNPYELPTWFELQVDQDGDAFRTYLEAAEVLLEPGETRKMRVMFEYTESAPRLSRRATSAVSLSGWIFDPRPDVDGRTADAPEQAGGVDFLVVNGWRTKFGGLESESTTHGYTVRGDIHQVGSGERVAGGRVVLTTIVGRLRVEQPPIAVAGDGTFEATLPSDTAAVKARFFPDVGLGQAQRSESDWLMLE